MQMLDYDLVNAIHVCSSLTLYEDDVDNAIDDEDNDEKMMRKVRVM